MIDGKTRAAKIFFIIFVDGIFTTLFVCLFTNVFDVTAQTQAIACVYRAMQRRLTPSQPKFDTNKKIELHGCTGSIACV